MSRIAALLAVVLLALPAGRALADEQQIRAALEQRLGGVKVLDVQPTPMAGIYEVQLQSSEGPKILYTDAQGGYVLTGRMIDLKNDLDLTEARMKKLTAIDFGTLPLELAVKVQRGAGRRQLAMFSDPYCPYCRRLEQALLKIDDITVYVFMYPVIRPGSADHSRAVWCSRDRAKAWLELAAQERPRLPTAGADCANPVDKILELGRSLGVRSTPTLYFANGERVEGGMQIADLRAKLDEVARQSGK
jgi:thiol:disulfide interchange protein DsbC